MTVYLIPFLNIYICLFHQTQKKVCASNKQTASSKLLTMTCKLGIIRRKVNKNRKIALRETSRPTILPSCFRSKTKSIHEIKLKEKLPAGSSFSPLVIDDNLKTGDTSCGNFSMNNYTLSQQNFDSNNGNVSSGYGFKTATLYPNVNIQVPLSTRMGILKTVMVM